MALHDPIDRRRNGADASPSSMPVITINVDGDLQGREADIAFIIGSIFAQPEFTDVRAELIAHVLRSPVSNHTDVVAGIIDFLRVERERGDAARVGLLTSLDQRLQEHLQEAVETRQAYLSRKRDIHKVFWPKLVDLPRSDLVIGRIPLIDPSTPVSSAGSCFATYVRDALVSLRFNYLETEANRNASAAWGLIFNAMAFRQLVEFAFGIRERPRVLFPMRVPREATWLDRSKPLFMDPIREQIFFSSAEEYAASYDRHRAACRHAFEQSELFIFTLGMSEVWQYKVDGSAMAMEPKSVPAFLVNKRILTAQDTTDELERALQVLRAHNPRLKLLLTVSPVPLHATFRGDDMHVVTANCYSKSALRAAADELCRRHPDHVYYFPAYEKIMYCTPDAWTEDGRHPTDRAVVGVMELFLRTFLKDGVELTAPTWGAPSSSAGA
jgi:hypothetical protein